MLKDLVFLTNEGGILSTCAKVVYHTRAWNLRGFFYGTIIADHIRPKRSGPYKVLTILKSGAYELTDMEGSVLPRLWNVNHLKKFHA